MEVLHFTLVADGPSDACLIHVINWVLSRDPQVRYRHFRVRFADTRLLREPPKGLAARIEAGYRQFPCDVLFVHRDAEREPTEKRYQEISEAIISSELPYHVPVIPVRMTEAWLLINERAIRRAADNPNGAVRLDLPPLRKLELLPDPKKILKGCLVDASELKGRRRDQFERGLSRRVYRVAELIPDYSPLRQLRAFHQFEVETYRVLAETTSRISGSK